MSNIKYIAFTNYYQRNYQYKNITILRRGWDAITKAKQKIQEFQKSREKVKYEQKSDPLLAALSQLVSNLQNQQSASSSNITNILQNQVRNFEPFDKGSENFKSYCQSLECLKKIKSITSNDTESNNRKVMVPINCIGSKLYQLLSNITAPYLPASKSYDQLITLLKEHLTFKRNILVEQHTFFIKIQEPGESLAEYIAGLKEKIGKTTVH